MGNEKVEEKMKHEKVTEDDRNESFLKEKTSMKDKEPMITRKKENIVPKQAENEKIKPKLKHVEKMEKTTENNKIENIQLKPVKKKTEVTHDSKIEKEEKEADKTKKDTFTKDDNGSVPTTVQTEEPETKTVEKNQKAKNDMKNKTSNTKPK